jgi:hypothetical protein
MKIEMVLKKPAGWRTGVYAQLGAASEVLAWLAGPKVVEMPRPFGCVF